MPRNNEDVAYHSLKLAGSVIVKFPLRPYISQIEIISKMLSAIKKGQNGLFESPTGTGKSLAILLGALSLQEQHNSALKDQVASSMPLKISDNMSASSPIKRGNTIEFERNAQSSPIPKGREDILDLSSDGCMNQPNPSSARWNGRVIISSRTQKQLMQLEKELEQKTTLNPSMAMVASREFYCIHPERNTWNSKDEECMKLRAGKIPSVSEISANPKIDKIHCPFEPNSTILANQTKFRTELWDIEQLVEAGKTHQACPFYAARHLGKDAKLLFAPYNYILDPKIRKACSIQLNGSVLVIDEAHNVEQVATDGVTVKFSELDLLIAKEDLKRVRNAVAGIEQWVVIIEELISYFLQFCHRYKHIEMEEYDEDTNVCWKVIDGLDGREMMDRNFKRELATLQSAWSLMNPSDPLSDFNDKAVSLLVETKRLVENILMILQLLYEYDWAWCYKLVMSKNYETTDAEDDQFSFSWWCLSPKVSFDEIQRSVSSLILTSGTLSPLETFGPSLGIDFRKTAECLHVIKSHQIYARKISFSPSGLELNGKFKNRETNEYKDAVGESIFQILENSVQGSLVFMPSYSIMHQMFQRWKETGLYAKLAARKTIFHEPRTRLDEDFMNSYYGTCFDPNPGLLFCVYRGKLSEGIDFANEQARTVICVGIPYPALFDPLVQEKKRFHDKGWYDTQAYRAINQALGRCIRHSKDWGAVLMLDSRINPDMLPKWYRTFLKHSNDWNSIAAGITELVKVNQRVYCYYCGHGVLVSNIVGCVVENHQFCHACYKSWFMSEFENIATMIQEGDPENVGLNCRVNECPLKLSVEQIEQIFNWLDLQAIVV